MSTAPNANIERVLLARAAFSRREQELKTVLVRSRLGADNAARRRELARLLRTIRGLMRQPN